MPKLAYKCKDCLHVYDIEEEACACEAKHKAPRYIQVGRKGGTAMHKAEGNPWLDDAGYEHLAHHVYYHREAGLWDLNFTVKDGKLIAVGSGQTKHLDGMELIPCTREEHKKDNRRDWSR